MKWCTKNKLLLLLALISPVALATGGYTQSAKGLLDGYKQACDTCSDTVEQLAENVSRACSITTSEFIVQTPNLLGVQMLAIAQSVGHPQSYLLDRFALSNLDCNNLGAWSEKIVDYSYTLDEYNADVDSATYTAPVVQ
ncbi:hypothetical protein ACPV5O_21155 [Vibrio maritimus]|jgi:hypothetical protein|uniref:hypothetical protein n=1 Tax=Vibrio maritimus TaxID=990268 RepID=UPI004068126E